MFPKTIEVFFELSDLGVSEIKKSLKPYGIEQVILENDPNDITLLFKRPIDVDEAVEYIDNAIRKITKGYARFYANKRLIKNNPNNKIIYGEIAWDL